MLQLITRKLVGAKVGSLSTAFRVQFKTLTKLFESHSVYPFFTLLASRKLNSISAF